MAFRRLGRRATIALAAALCFSGSVQAQSTITLYGLAQTAIDFTHFSSTPASSGRSGTFLTNETSFFGFQGNEDLGGGLAAIFKLETWFSLANGSLTIPNTLFSREAYVGLSSKTLGTLQAGSIYTPALWVSYAVDPYYRANNGSIYNLMQQVPPRNPIRGFIPTQNNAIEYISPVVAGAVTVRAMYAPSGQVGALSKLGEMYSGSVEYDKKPLYIGVSYERSYVNASSIGADSSIRANSTVTIGAAYTFPWFRLSGYLLRNQLHGFETANGYLVGVSVPIGISRLVSSYASRHTVDQSGTRAGVFAIGYYYPLSKRTTLFTSLAQMHNGSDTAYGLWPSETIYNAQGFPKGGQTVRSVELGIKHLF